LHSPNQKKDIISPVERGTVKNTNRMQSVDFEKCQANKTKNL
jgi:hypothetical protein